MKHYFLIGDVHSQGRLLCKALTHCKAQGLTPILLGDLFDSRCSESSTLYVWNLVKDAQDTMGAIVLHSNHHARLIEFLNGNFECQYDAPETLKTYEDFKEAGVDLEELKAWLERMPDGYVFSDTKGRRYACAHAYFPAPYLCGDPGGDYSVMAKEATTRDLMIWGIYNHRRQRVKWWKQNCSRSWTRVAGHYHTVIHEETNIILDGNAGFDDGQLACFDVEAQEVVYFG